MEDLEMSGSWGCTEHTSKHQKMVTFAIETAQ